MAGSTAGNPLWSQFEDVRDEDTDEMHRDVENPVLEVNENISSQDSAGLHQRYDSTSYNFLESADGGMGLLELLLSGWFCYLYCLRRR